MHASARRLSVMSATACARRRLIRVVRRRMKKTAVSKLRSAKHSDYRSLVDLGQITDFDLTGSEAGFIQKIHSVRKKWLRDFTPDEIRVCLAQEIGVAFLVPKALSILNDNPWIEAEYYEGDLLKTCIDVPDDYWKDKNEEKDLMKEVLLTAHRQVTNGKVSTGRQELRDLERGFRKFGMNTEQDDPPRA